MKYLYGTIAEKNLCSMQLHIFFQQNFRRKLRYNFIYELDSYIFNKFSHPSRFLCKK